VFLRNDALSLNHNQAVRTSNLTMMFVLRIHTSEVYISA
jgi:hypothetical protein